VLEREENHRCLWGTKGLQHILENQGDSFEKEYTHHGLPMIWIPQKKAKLRIQIVAKKSFYNGDSDLAFGANAKPNPDAKAVRNTIAAGERGRAFEAEEKKKKMTGTSFAGGRRCLRKRNEKGLRNGRRRIFGNKLRRNGKRFSFFSYLEKTGSQLQTPKYRYGAILCKSRRKKCNFLKTMDVCFPCWEERKEPHQENRKGLRTFL